MTSKIKYQKDYTEFNETYQLVLPLSLEGLVPNDDSVRLLSHELEELDYTLLYKASRIEITILFPNQIGNQFVSKNTFGIGNEQCQYIKLLTCQVDHPFPNPDSAVFQA